MPRGNTLIKQEQGKIIQIHCQGKNTDEIATMLNKSKKIVWQFIQAPEKYGKTRLSGLSSKLKK